MLKSQEESRGNSNQTSNNASGIEVHCSSSGEGRAGGLRSASSTGSSSVGGVARAGNKLEVGTGQAGGVARVYDERLVTKVVWRARSGGKVVVGEGGGEGRSGGNVTVLAGKIASLAGLRSCNLASVKLATLGGIKMGHRSSAVAVGRNRELVNMVH